MKRFLFFMIVACGLVFMTSAFIPSSESVSTKNISEVCSFSSSNYKSIGWKDFYDGSGRFQRRFIVYEQDGLYYANVGSVTTPDYRKLSSCRADGFNYKFNLGDMTLYTKI